MARLAADYGRIAAAITRTSSYPEFPQAVEARLRAAPSWRSSLECPRPVENSRVPHIAVASHVSHCNLTVKHPALVPLEHARGVMLALDGAARVARCRSTTWRPGSWWVCSSARGTSAAMAASRRSPCACTSATRQTFEWLQRTLSGQRALRPLSPRRPLVLPVVRPRAVPPRSHRAARRAPPGAPRRLHGGALRHDVRALSNRSRGRRARRVAPSDGLSAPGYNPGRCWLPPLTRGASSPPRPRARSSRSWSR